MTVGQFSVGLGIIMMAVQFVMILRLRANGQVGQGMFWFMMAIATSLPVGAYLIFYLWLPDYGSLAFAA